MKGFLDIETGGFSITKNGICEIALIAVDEQLNPIDTFQVYILPYKREDSNELVSYKEDSMVINGITMLDLFEKGIDVELAMTKMEAFITKHGITTIIGHNSKAFDIPRVQYLMDRFNKDSVFVQLSNDDTLILAKQKLTLSSYKLKDLCVHFSIVNPKEHSAIGDALATLELYKKLIA